MILLRSAHMGGILLMGVLLATARETTQRDPGVEQPAHRVLFESGFYTQTLEYLDGRIERPRDSLWEDYQSYRAFSLIMIDMRDSARSVFQKIFDARPDFRLSPLTTSPKLYEVYLVARQSHVPAVSDTPLDTASATESDAVPPDSAPVAAVDSAARLRAPGTEGARFALYFVPGGAAQFYHRRPAKGAVLLLTQVAALGASLLTYAVREDAADPRYGWYAGNAETYRRYTYSYRISFSLAALAYAFGVVDAFVTDGRRRRAPVPQEQP